MAEEFPDRKPSSVKVNISEKTRKYYEGEAAVARNPSDPHHLNPVFPEGAKVICVGCGGGWEGEAAGTSRFVGVDIDEEARDFRLARNPNDEFRLASGEQLPFGDGEFTSGSGSSFFGVCKPLCLPGRHDRRVVRPQAIKSRHEHFEFRSSWRLR